VRNAQQEAWRRNRVEALLARPGLLGAMGELRSAVLEVRGEAEAALADADARLRAAAGDRLAAAARLRACNRALVGTGQVADPATGVPVQYLRRRSDSFEDPLPAAASLEVLRGEGLRDVVVGILQTVAEPLAVADLVRILAAHGFTAPGRPSQAVSNALRFEVRQGCVWRVGRGRYASVKSERVLQKSAELSPWRRIDIDSVPR
jgi:hypothetical protein